MKILIRATVNALGLHRGDEVWVDADSTADTMIDSGYWIWLNPPTPTFEEYEVTDAVRERLDAKAGRVDAFAEALWGGGDAQESPGEESFEAESD
jgi:hypothetical protein